MAISYHDDLSKIVDFCDTCANLRNIVPDTFQILLIFIKRE